MGLTLCFVRPAYDVEESVGLSLLFKLRGVRKPPAEVVVVSIDKESAEQLKVSGIPSNWPRSLHASLVEELTRAGAQLIVFDLYFLESRSLAEDGAFAAMLSKSRNVILGEAVRARDLTNSGGPNIPPAEHRLATAIKPIDAFAREAAATAPFVLPRLPVRVNRYWTFPPSLGHVPTSPVVAFQLYTLPLYADFRRLLQEASPVAAEKLPEDALRVIQTKGASRFIKGIRETTSDDPLILTRITEALERSNLATVDLPRYRKLKSLAELYYGDDQRYLNFYGPPRTIRTIPFHRVIRSGKGMPGAPQDFSGKVVFVGLSETLLTEREDGFHTVFSDANGVFVSGVEIVATVFANLAENSTVMPLDSHYYLLLVFSWGMVIGVICCTFGPFVAAAGVLVSGATYLAVAEHLFATKGAWVPVAIPLLVQAPLGYFGVMLWTYVEINKERQNIRKALGFYVPDDVVRELARNVVDLKKGDQTVDGVCLFTDVASYTTVSESISPRELSDLMRRYLEAGFEPIKRNGGLVIDLTGDSILAIWKAAEPNAPMREQACNAAVELAKAIRRFNQAAGTLQLPTRIGVHAGPIFLGNIGAGDN